MPIEGNDPLDTAYTDVIAAFDTLAQELEDAAVEEEAVPAGGDNSEYQHASDILGGNLFKCIQSKVNQMRKESSAASTPKYYSLEKALEEAP